MREFKIFLVVAFFTALTYWGVEPYAHSVMKPHVSPANFDFAAEDINFAKSEIEAKELALKEAQNSKDGNLIESATKALDLAKENLVKQEELWGVVAKIDFSKGDATKGREFFEGNCYACHGASIDDLPANITDSSMGVIPPDLSSAGLLYDEKFLAALVMHPARALKVEHKFGDAFIMTAYNSEMSGESEEVVAENLANLIVYLKNAGQRFKAREDERILGELSAKYASVEDEAQKAKLIEKDTIFANQKLAFTEACGRCHNMRYDGFFTASNADDLKGYLGSNPPDLSMMIRSRGEQYLNDFINNTQKLLNGTAMPRVGLNEASQAQVLGYLENVGDSKKEERENLGLYIMSFFVILSIFAIAWKRKIWSNLH